MLGGAPASLPRTQRTRSAIALERALLTMPSERLKAQAKSRSRPAPRCSMVRIQSELVLWKPPCAPRKAWRRALPRSSEIHDRDELDPGRDSPIVLPAERQISAVIERLSPGEGFGRCPLLPDERGDVVAHGAVAVVGEAGLVRQTAAGGIRHSPASPGIRSAIGIRRSTPCTRFTRARTAAAACAAGPGTSGRGSRAPRGSRRAAAAARHAAAVARRAARRRSAGDAGGPRASVGSGAARARTARVAAAGAAEHGEQGGCSEGGAPSRHAIQRCCAALTAIARNRPLGKRAR